jgi:hypothetical protein
MITSILSLFKLTILLSSLFVFLILLLSKATNKKFSYPALTKAGKVRLINQ